LGKEHPIPSGLKGRQTPPAFPNAHGRRFAMPQSLAKIYVHLIFSTKNREMERGHSCPQVSAILRMISLTPNQALI
jgi:hypothetical protein